MSDIPSPFGSGELVMYMLSLVESEDNLQESVLSTMLGLGDQTLVSGWQAAGTFAAEHSHWS